MKQKPSSLDFGIAIEGFSASYSWGLGDQEYFLNNTELQIQGTVRNGPTAVGKTALIDIETIKGEEPLSYDKDWFNDVVSIGRLEVAEHTIYANTVIARSGIQSILQLLNLTNTNKELFITSDPLKEDGLGGQKGDILRIWVYTK